MRERELRLALVCYGGVSLAVYMHGITKEIWHLSRASRRFHDDGSGDEGSREDSSGQDSVDVYRDLLAELAAGHAVKLRVVTDIIAGSSAGGVNGIFLGHAIATGRSLDPLTSLWLDYADVERLLDPDGRVWAWVARLWSWPIAALLLRRRRRAMAATVAASERAEVSRKLSRFVRARWFHPPFSGAKLLRMLLNAFAAMEQTPAGPSLLPAGHPLDLFVTTTDFYGHAQTLRLHSPLMVIEKEHRVCLTFSTRSDRGSHVDDIAALSFAARATSCFPGAFPPFRVAELDAVLAERKRAWPERDGFLQSSFPNRAARGNAEDVVLIDGSVLANAPFTQAIRALRNRPARREVDRRFVYIDPIPDDDSFQHAASNGMVPRFFSTILGAASNIPRWQPIRESLEAIELRSERIREQRRISDHLRAEIEQTVEAMLGRTLLLSWPTPRRIGAWRARAHERAARAAGFTYAAYGHLKLSGVIDEMAATLLRAQPDAPVEMAARLRAAIAGELDARGLDHLARPTGGATPAAISFFQVSDLRFRVRRLRFLARRLAEDVEAHDIAADSAADAVHDAIFEALALYFERETSAFLGTDFADAAERALTEPGAVIDALIAQRALIATDAEVDSLLCRALVQLPAAARRTMLLAYIGFPLYDIATLPLMQGNGLDEYDPIKVDRISPEDATSLSAGEATLKGTELNNFGAFFSRAYRENDYLWGRLHSAERMVDIILSTMTPADGDVTIDADRYKQRLFSAILDEEAPRLSAVAPLIARLREAVAQQAELID